MRRRGGVSFNQLCAVLLVGGCQAPSVEIPSPDISEAVRLDVSELDTAPVLSAVKHQLDGPEFGSIGGIALASDAVYVVDNMNAEIASFDFEGRLIQRFGRTGGGPGELERPRSIAIIHDTVFVLDSNGLSAFSRGGQFLQRSPLKGGPVVGDRFVPNPRELLAGCDGLAITYRWTLSDHESPFADTVRVHRLSNSGEVGPPTHHIITDHIYASGQNVRGPPFFVPQQQVIQSPDCTLVVAHQDGRTLDRQTTDGAVLLRLHLYGSQRPVTSADVDTIVHGPTVIPAVIPPEALRRAKADMLKHPRARNRSFVDGLIVDAGGNMLIRRADQSPISRMSPDHATWHLLSPEGAPQGSIRLPGAFRPRQALPGLIAGVLLGPDLDETAVLYTYDRKQLR